MTDISGLTLHFWWRVRPKTSVTLILRGAGVCLVLFYIYPIVPYALALCAQFLLFEDVCKFFLNWNVAIVSIPALLKKLWITLPLTQACIHEWIRKSRFLCRSKTLLLDTLILFTRYWLFKQLLLLLWTLFQCQNI